MVPGEDFGSSARRNSHRVVRARGSPSAWKGSTLAGLVMNTCWVLLVDITAQQSEDYDTFDNRMVTHSIFSGVKTCTVGRNAADCRK
jgi:hypothetical protein